MIISVPKSWNLSHKSLFSREQSTLCNCSLLQRGLSAAANGLFDDLDAEVVPEECGESRSRSSPVADPGRDELGLGDGLRVSSRSEETLDKGGDKTPESWVSFTGDGAEMKERGSGNPGLDRGSEPEKKEKYLSLVEVWFLCQFLPEFTKNLYIISQQI